MDTIEKTQKFKDSFYRQAIEHGEAIAIGDHKKANKLHKKLQVLYNQANEQNNAEIFAQFLKDNNDSVKLWAAVFSLKSSPEVALNVLQELSERNKIIGLTAKTTLDLWHSGKLPS